MKTMTSAKIRLFRWSLRRLQFALKKDCFERKCPGDNPNEFVPFSTGFTSVAEARNLTTGTVALRSKYENLYGGKNDCL